MRTPDEVKACLSKVCEYIYEHGDLIRLLIQANVDMEIASSISGLYRDFREDKSRLGVLKNADDDSLQMTAAFIGGGCYFMIRKWLLDNIRKTPEEVADLLFKILNMGSE